ncbi:hypothetical protein [Synechococcus sp. 1G10]|uniref:hypothetical protein n=1 Tax=Synechococcus sp. 1G10 TaxID=2025605 RepID=UPI001E2F09F2|nr:hypothetical protein [Synechococcus sp. 1G10]
MRRFDGINLISDRIPEVTTILAFCPILEKQHLGEQIFPESGKLQTKPCVELMDDAAREHWERIADEVFDRALPSALSPSLYPRVPVQRAVRTSSVIHA